MVFCAVSHLEWLWNSSKPSTRGWVAFNKSYYPEGYWQTSEALNCKDHAYCFRHNCPQIGLNPRKRINHTSLTISLSMFANLFCLGLQRHFVNAAQKRSRNTVSHRWFGLVFNWSHPVLNPRVEPILQGFLEGLRGVLWGSDRQPEKWTGLYIVYINLEKPLKIKYCLQRR